MRKEIVNSWRRCQNYGLRQDATELKTEALDEEKLRELKAEHQLLLDVALPIIKDLHDFVSGSGFLTLLTTRDGVILEVLNDPTTRSFTSEFQLSPGKIWREEIIGTSAIGLVIKEGKPIQVVGREHFWQRLHNLTCSAAPIFDEEGQLLGIVNVSGPVELVHAHTLGMVVSAAKAIERQYLLANVTNKIKQSNVTLNALLNMVEDAVILVDESFTIKQANERAAKILDLTPAEMIGKTIDEFFDNPVLQESILSQTPIQNEVMTVKTKPITCLVQAKPLLIAEERVATMVTFREAQHIRRLAKRIEGNKAYITMNELVGSSEVMNRLRKKVQLVAQSDATTLILGETGSGKEMVAQSIHNLSDRKEGPFIVVNCAAIPRSLLESELFGYEPGTFTGGLKQGKPGKFELANGGTIFLDEIGELTPDLQVILLRVLQEQRITRVGGSKPIPVDIRVIAATNKDLKKAIKKGEFRSDLYYRLNILQIHIPPLRSRTQDIPDLVHWFITKWTPENAKPKKFSKEAIEFLQRHSWPGNVRELENIVQRCIVMIENPVIRLQDIKEIMGDADDAPHSFENSTLKIQDVEKEVFLETYYKCNGDLTKTARLLGISRATVYRWAKKYKIHLNH
jgi:transcriptional regulator of acetoin/glycerol metabolism